MLATGSRCQHQIQIYNIRQYMSGWGQTSAVPPSELLVMSQWTCQMYSGCFYTNIKLCPFCPQLADPTISCSLIDHNFISLQFGVLNLITNLISTVQSAGVRVLSGRDRRQEELRHRFSGEFSLVSLIPDPRSALALCTDKQTRSSFPTHLPEKTSLLKIHSRLKLCKDTFKSGSHHQTGMGSETDMKTLQVSVCFK